MGAFIGRTVGWCDPMRTHDPSTWHSHACVKKRCQGFVQSRRTTACCSTLHWSAMAMECDARTVERCNLWQMWVLRQVREYRPALASAQCRHVDIGASVSIDA